jgi:4-hydroxy-2-oxoheptanedioate aldolase
MPTGRLNNIIHAWEHGRPAFASFAPADPHSAIEFSTAPYDGVIFEMEHNPFDVGALGDALQYLLNRKQILHGSLAPAVTPLARVPANGAERNQSCAKQVLDRGVYGVVFPHIGDADQAYNAVASCRYARPKTAPHYEPIGMRGDGPGACSRYWGLSQQEYYDKADVWPLNPNGEIVAIIQCESLKGMDNLDDILSRVQGVGCVLIGEGDLSQELGFPRQYEHPQVHGAMEHIVATCKKHNVPVGHPHVTTKNVERVIAEGFRFLMSKPVTTYAAIDKAKEVIGIK